MPRGVAQGHIIFTTRRDGLFCLKYIQQKLARKNNEFAFHPHKKVLPWVYSIAVLLALFGYTRYRRAHDRSVLDKIQTAPLDNTHKTFTPYDMYDFEKSVTIRTPAYYGPPESEKGHVWREMRHVLRTSEQEDNNT